MKEEKLAYNQNTYTDKNSSTEDESSDEDEWEIKLWFFLEMI